MKESELLDVVFKYKQETGSDSDNEELLEFLRWIKSPPSHVEAAGKEGEECPHCIDGKVWSKPPTHLEECPIVIQRPPLRARRRRKD